MSHARLSRSRVIRAGSGQLGRGLWELIFHPGNPDFGARTMARVRRACPNPRRRGIGREEGPAVEGEPTNGSAAAGVPIDDSIREKCHEMQSEAMPDRGPSRSRLNDRGGRVAACIPGGGGTGCFHGAGLRPHVPRACDATVARRLWLVGAPSSAGMLWRSDSFSSRAVWPGNLWGGLPLKS